MVTTFKGLATNLFGNIIDKYSKFFLPIKDTLPKADIKIPFRTYMSMIFLVSAFLYLASLVSIFFVLKVFIVSTFLMIAYLIFVPITIALISFTTLSFYPYQKANDRRRNIEVNLPFVLTHMGAIAESGIPPYIIFKLIGGFEEYGEVSQEMNKVVRNVDTFGLDPLTAIKEVAERTPSEDLKQILMGFVTTTESGGDVKSFLKNAGQQALFDWRIKREKFLQQLSAYAEFYTGLLIAAPLFIIALFSVMNMIQPSIAGMPITNLMELSVYGIVPAMNIGFLLLLKGTEVEM